MIRTIATKAVFACSVCFGAKDSILTSGLTAGILTLLTVLLFVFGGIGLFLFQVKKRLNALSLTARS